MKINLLKFNGVVLSLVGDISFDSETHMVTSLISSICWLCKDAHRSKDCVHVFIGVGVHIYFVNLEYLSAQSLKILIKIGFAYMRV